GAGGRGWTGDLRGGVVGDGPGRSPAAAGWWRAAFAPTAVTDCGPAAWRGLARGVVRDRGAGERGADPLGAKLAAVGNAPPGDGGAVWRGARRMADCADWRLRAGTQRAAAGRAVATVWAGVFAGVSAGERSRGMGRCAEPVVLGRVCCAGNVRLCLAGAARRSAAGDGWAGLSRYGVADGAPARRVWRGGGVAGDPLPRRDGRAAIRGPAGRTWLRDRVGGDGARRSVRACAGRDRPRAAGVIVGSGE